MEKYPLTVSAENEEHVVPEEVTTQLGDEGWEGIN